MSYCRQLSNFQSIAFEDESDDNYSDDWMEELINLSL